jgi:hypothetical protein
MDIAALSFPLENVRTLAGPENDVVLAGDIFLENDCVRVLFDLVASRHPISLLNVFPHGLPPSVIRYKSAHELHARLYERSSTTDVYVEAADPPIVGYSSPRDTLAVLSLPRRLLTGPISVEAWDRAFVRHILDTGVGFGVEGDAYARSLTEQLPLVRAAVLIEAIEERGRRRAARTMRSQLP